MVPRSALAADDSPLRVTALNPWSAVLQWSAPRQVARIEIRRNGRLLEDLATSHGSTLSDTDHLLWQSTTYAYEVIAFNRGNHMVSDQIASVTTPAPIGAFPTLYDPAPAIDSCPLRLLAEKTGVVIEESPGAGRQRELKRTISKLNLLAAQYFRHILLENPAGQRALIQLESRGVTRVSMTEFQLGFAPAGQRKDNLVRFLRKHGATDGEMLEAGLAIKV